MASTQSPKPRQATALIILSLVVIFLSSAIVEAAPPFVLPADAPINIKTQAALSRKTSSNKHERDGDGSQILKGTNKIPIRVCYQGEPGAYSEKSLRELLGSNVIAVPRPDFESCYRAVASKECDYACLPVENSLGGSIHDNYDLQLKYDLTIVAEHECRVSHCLHAMPGVKKSDIKYCMSHPQALAQCDNYLSGLGIKPVPMYDTAGSAKLLRDNAIAAKSPSDKKPSRALPDKCTLENTAAIASDLAGTTYQLNCLDKKIEDDDTNFTRFLLLGRSEASVSQYLNKDVPAKTSVVFTLPNTPGALYKALACFSLREIDFSKIESRPTSASLLNYLKFKSQALGKKNRNAADLPRFRYCFYLDFLASELDENAQNALHHLKEQAEFCRILGSYPQKSKLVGPVHNAVEEAKLYTVENRDQVTQMKLPSDDGYMKLNVGIMGYGVYGQFLGRKFAERHNVRCIDSLDKFKEAEENGAEFYPNFEMHSFLQEIDVLIIAVPMIEFESAVSSLPKDSLANKLVVEVCSLGVAPKKILLSQLPESADIISSNPMFGPSGADNSCEGQPMVYDKVRVRDERRADAYLNVFERARCQMVKMTAEQQDAHMADAEFVTHLAGRILGSGKMLPPTPVSSKEYAALCDVTDMTSGDTFDLFYGMYKYNPRAKEHISKLRENLAKVERQLAAKEAYLAAKAELQDSDRQRLIAECRQLLHEVAKKSSLNSVGDIASAVKKDLKKD
eukprot:scaffold10532_cov449-Chaetoceros_neogracile.AAC.23